MKHRLKFRSAQIPLIFSQNEIAFCDCIILEMTENQQSALVQVCAQQNTCFFCKSVLLGITVAQLLIIV